MIEKWTREQIKNLVYNCASKKYYDRAKFYTYVLSKPDDGEDLQLYNEIGFDSLDMVQFLADIEDKLKTIFKVECMINDKIITYDVTFRNIIDYIWKRTMDKYKDYSHLNRR